MSDPGFLAHSPSGVLAFHKVSHKLITVASPITPPEPPDPPTTGSRWDWWWECDIYMRNICSVVATKWDEDLQENVHELNLYNWRAVTSTAKKVPEFPPRRLEDIRYSPIKDVPSSQITYKDDFKEFITVSGPGDNEEGGFEVVVGGRVRGNYQPQEFVLARVGVGSTYGIDYRVFYMSGVLVGARSTCTVMGWVSLTRRRLL